MYKKYFANILIMYKICQDCCGMNGNERELLYWWGEIFTYILCQQTWKLALSRHPFGVAVPLCNYLLITRLNKWLQYWSLINLFFLQHSPLINLFFCSLVICVITPWKPYGKNQEMCMYMSWEKLLKPLWENRRKCWYDIYVLVFH